MNRYYDFWEASKIIGIGYTHVSRKVKKLGIKCKIGRYGKKYLTEKQVEKLRPTYMVMMQEPTGNVIEIIKVTETFYIYQSKMNAL